MKLKTKDGESIAIKCDVSIAAEVKEMMTVPKKRTEN